VLLNIWASVSSVLSPAEQVDRQDDHRAAQGDLLEHLPGTPDSKT
jgi:hypothetical protein